MSTRRTKKYTKALHHLEWDVVILTASIILAYFLVGSGILSRLLTFTQGMELIVAFIAGIFFTSMFTIAAAAAAFVKISNPDNLILISLIGAMGAVCGDMLLFLFIRDAIIEDLRTVIKTSSYKKLVFYFHGGFLRWLGPLLGALIIATPLPDELGLALMGMSKVRTAYMIPVTFVMNFFGIWGILALTNAFPW
ncbi:MAG: hypothetical protein ABIT47_03180 [Candidatus Paceibacterota bacterium]